MTTEELLQKVSDRFHRTGNPTLPPEETLKAILDLGKELEEAKATIFKMGEDLTTLASKLESAKARESEAEFHKREAEDEAKKYEWLAHELCNFIGDIANGIYEGQERAAANRVYDLNGSTIRKRRLNAYNFDSLQEAVKAYQWKHDEEPAISPFLQWLFAYAEKPIRSL